MGAGTGSGLGLGRVNQSTRLNNRRRPNYACIEQQRGEPKRQQLADRNSFKFNVNDHRAAAIDLQAEKAVRPAAPCASYCYPAITMED